MRSTSGSLTLRIRNSQAGGNLPHSEPSTPPAMAYVRTPVRILPREGLFLFSSIHGRMAIVSKISSPRSLLKLAAHNPVNALAGKMLEFQQQLQGGHVAASFIF